LTTLCAQDDQFIPPAPPTQPAAEEEEQDFEVLSRGPVHEAFAEQYNQDPVPGLIVDQEPPEPIDELPPETMPDGNNVQWVSGYFAWDEDLNDFVWISGFWRDFPPGQRWVPGYWNKTEDGRYQWVSGFWTPEQTAELDYLPYPPESLEQGPNIAAPGENYQWVPGCWVWRDYDYHWRPGYWQVCYDDWVWYPDRYTWTPRGAIFCPGFYDYRIPYRGTLFAPVYFPRLAWWRQRYGYYTPGITIGLNNLALHLFVRPSYGHYYFGDYYGPRYAGFGFYPWYLGGGYGFGRGFGYGFYDPLLVFYNHYHRRHHGIHYAGRLKSWHDHYDRHPDDRPRRTFREERDFLARHGDRDGHDHDHVRQAVLTQSLGEHVRSEDSRREFRHIDRAERENHSRSSRHVRELTELRRGTERADKDANVALRSRSDRRDGVGEIGSPNVGDNSSQRGDSQRRERHGSLALPEVEPRHGHQSDSNQGRGRSRSSHVPDIASLPDRPGQGGSQRRSIDRGVPSNQFQPSQPGQGRLDRGSSRRRSDHSSGHRSSDPRVQQTPQFQTPERSQGGSRSRSRSGGSSSEQYQPQPRIPSAGSSRGGSSRGGSSASGSRGPIQIPGASSRSSRGSGRSLQSPSGSSRSSRSSGLGSSRSRSSGSSGASRSHSSRPSGASRSRSSGFRSSGSSGAGRSRSSAPRRSSATSRSSRSSSAARRSSGGSRSSSRGSSRSSSRGGRHKK
jgi:hypothetical protein